MVYNCFIKCQVCGSITRIRLQVGWQDEHPIVIACGKCGISLIGKVNIGQNTLGVSFSFDNANIVDDSEAEYLVECSGEFPTKKMCEDVHDFDISPFIRNQARMQSSDGYEQFRKNVSILNRTVQRWAEYKRVFELSQNANTEYLIQEVKKIIPENIVPGRNKLEILRAVHMVEVVGFISPLRNDIISDITVSNSVLKLDFEQITELIEYLDSHDGYSLKEMQSSIYKVMGEFLDVFKYLVPAYVIQFYKDGKINYIQEGSTTSSFDLVKQFYLDAYETLGNLLILPIALNNIKYRNDYKIVNPMIEKKEVSLNQFLELPKATRYHFCNPKEVYTDYLHVTVNSKLRNAIGHNDVEYDSTSQQIVYIPDPKKRMKKRTSYLLEFENEALHMFQAILAIDELLYRIKEVDLLNKGEIPFQSGFPITKGKKIGRNELCPCGSGKKFKKCCSGKGIYD